MQRQKYQQLPGTMDSAAYIARQFIQATLPHSNPSGLPGVVSHQREFTLSIRLGYATDPKRGALLLATCRHHPGCSLLGHTEVVRTRNRHMTWDHPRGVHARVWGSNPSRGGKRK